MSNEKTQKKTDKPARVGYNPFQGGYTPVDERGNTAPGTSAELPAPPVGGTGETLANAGASAGSS